MKNLLHILTGLFSPKLFSDFPFSVGTAVSLMPGSLPFCAFNALPRNPEALFWLKNLGYSFGRVPLSFLSIGWQMPLGEASRKTCI